MFHFWHSSDRYCQKCLCYELKDFVGHQGLPTRQKSLYWRIHSRMPEVVAQPSHSFRRSFFLPATTWAEKASGTHAIAFLCISQDLPELTQERKMPRGLLNSHVRYSALLCLHEQGELIPAGLKCRFVSWTCHPAQWMCVQLPVLAVFFRWYIEVSQLPCSHTQKLPLFSYFPSCLRLFLADRLSNITC